MPGPSFPVFPQKHPRITIEDEDGKLRLADLFLSLTNPVLPPMSMQAVARISAAAITTSYAPLVTISNPVRIIQVFNSLGSSSDVTLGVQFGGSGPIVDKWRLEGDGFTLDMQAGRSMLPPTTIIHIKYTTQPSSGSLRVVFL